MKVLPLVAALALVLSLTSGGDGGVAALRVAKWDVDVQVFGVAAHSLSMPLPAHKQPNDTRPPGNPSPFDESASPSALMSYYQVALVRVEFDAPVWVSTTNGTTHHERSDGASVSGDALEALGLQRLDKLTAPDALHGVTRLICDTALIESHPPVTHTAAAAHKTAPPRASDPLEFDTPASDAAARLAAEEAAAAAEHARFADHKFRSRPPLFLVPFMDGYSDELPLLSLISAYLRPSSATTRSSNRAQHFGTAEDDDADGGSAEAAATAADRTYTVALVLGYTHLNALDGGDAADNDAAREDVRQLTEAQLSRCSLHFLKASSQSVSPPRVFHDRAGVPFNGRILLRPESAAPSATDKSKPNGGGAASDGAVGSWHGAASKPVRSAFASPSDETCAFPSVHAPHTGSRDAARAAQMRGRVLKEVRALIEPTLRLLLDAQVPSLLEVSTQGQVQYKGLVDALVTPVINGVKSVFSMIVSSSTADTLVEPVVNHVVSGIGEAVVAHLEPFVSGKVIENIVPATTESIADTVTQTVSEALADMMAEMMVEPVTTDLTDLLSRSVIVPVRDRVATEAALKIAHKLTHSLTHTLSRSLSHSIVGALIHSVTQNPLMDYYCYYCSKFERYCFYCRRSPRQMYYALYYTGYYSSYYGQYYTSVFTKKLGVKVVRRKTVHDFGEEPRVDETFTDKAAYDRNNPQLAHWIY